MISKAQRHGLNEKSEQRQRVRSKPTGVRRHPLHLEQQSWIQIKNGLGWLVLVPLATVTFFTLSEMFWRAVSRVDFWRSEPLVFFVIGGLAWAAAWWAGLRPMHTYVFGHEVSHMLMARVFGGKIYDWGHSAKGGFVKTDKTNTWITLAPYLIPLYSVVVMALYVSSGLLLDVHEALLVEAGPLSFRFKPAWFFYILLGLTWWFHATYTCITVHLQQSDLTRNGEFFSMLLIFVCNLALLVALFLASSSAPGLGLGAMLRCWMATAGGFWQFLTLGMFA